MYATAGRLGNVDATGTASPGTQFVGGCTAAGVCYQTGVDVPNDPRPIASPSYMWGARPVYVMASPDDWRPDLYRYDVNGVQKFASTDPVSTSGGIIPADPPAVQTVAVLNPIVITAAAPAGTVPVSRKIGNAIANSSSTWLVLAGLAGLFLLSPRR
jgi:hypothetical protein